MRGSPGSDGASPYPEGQRPRRDDTDRSLARSAWQSFPRENRPVGHGMIQAGFQVDQENRQDAYSTVRYRLIALGSQCRRQPDPWDIARHSEEQSSRTE